MYKKQTQMSSTCRQIFGLIDKTVIELIIGAVNKIILFACIAETPMRDYF